MNEINKQASDFTGYEYKKVTVPSEQASMYLDGYESFGWQEDERFGQTHIGLSCTLNLRRDRKILNKMELTRLQRNFEASMEEIITLERSKTTLPQIVSLAVGIIGTAFMAGSVFAVTANPPIIWLCILLALPAFAGWILPYFLYTSLLGKRKKIVEPLIEQKYDEIYSLCEKGNTLLN